MTAPGNDAESGATAAGATEAGADGTPAASFGIGQFRGADGLPVAWPVSQEEVGRDTAVAAHRLEELDLGRGSRVLVVSLLAEAGQFWPWILASMFTGIQLSLADATESDAARVAMFRRWFDYDAMLGIDDRILDGLETRGEDPRRVFGGTRVLAARPGAYERLRAAGLPVHRFVLCGPVVALSDEPAGPARYDADEWDLESPAGRVLVTSRGPRATQFVRTPTDLTGRVANGAVVPDDVDDLRGAP